MCSVVHNIPACMLHQRCHGLCTQAVQRCVLENLKDEQTLCLMYTVWSVLMSMSHASVMQDLSAFVQSTVQAAVQEAALDQGADDSADQDGNKGSKTNDGAADAGDFTIARDMKQTDQRGTQHSRNGAVRSSQGGANSDVQPSAAEQCEVPGQPQTSIRLYKAQVKVRDAYAAHTLFT